MGLANACLRRVFISNWFPTEIGRYLESEIPSFIQFGNSGTVDIALDIKDSDNGIGLEASLEFDMDISVLSSPSGTAAIISQSQVHATVMDPDGRHAK